MTEYGITTFGAVPQDLRGKPDADARTIRSVVEQGVLADRLGIDAFGVGEHHRADIPVSAPDMILSAVAGRTSQIILGSAVTVLSSDDPVRVYERFATLDAISGGRAQPILGRGSFTESFALFGFDIREYNELFEERVALFAELRRETPVTWSGSTRASLHHQQVYPKTSGQQGLTSWVGVGGSPESVVRAARYGYNLMMAGLGQTQDRIAQYLELYHQSLTEFGVAEGLTGLSVIGYIADTDERARDEAWPVYEDRFNKTGKERGWPLIDRSRFEDDIDRGLLLIGSPMTVGTRLGHLAHDLRLDRIDVNYDDISGTLDSKNALVEYLGTEAIPIARQTQARDQRAAASQNLKESSLDLDLPLHKRHQPA